MINYTPSDYAKALRPAPQIPVGGGMVGQSGGLAQSNPAQTVGQQQPHQPQINPGMAMNAMKMFGGGGGGAAGGGGGGMLASAGPWAALAAAIAINEEDSRKRGLRAEDRGERARDMLTGKVLTQDIEGKWGPMFDKWTGGNASSLGLTGDMKGGSQIASGRLDKGFKTLYKEGTTGKIVNALKKIF